MTAIHENLFVYKKIKSTSNRNFCFLCACVLALFGCYPLVHSYPLRLWALVISSAFLLLAFIKPKIVAPLNYLWTKLGLLLGKVMTPIIMGILYYSMFLLTGLILKLIKKDILKLKLDPSATTYWSKNENKASIEETFKLQF